MFEDLAFIFAKQLNNEQINYFMSKIKFTIAGFLFLSFSIFAQIKDTTYWNRSLDLGLNINQSWFNKDWTAGGVNNWAITMFAYGNSKYVKNRHSITSTMFLDYGVINAASAGWRKNVDRIFVDNIYALAIKGPWGAWGGFNFQSQFTSGYKGGDPTANRISTFMAPGYLTEAFGIIYAPVPFFEARFAPIAFRQTFSIDGQIERNVANKKGEHYGVKPGLTLKNEFGYFFLAKFDKDLVTNINMKLLYQHFGAYDNLGHTTNRLDAVLSAKIYKIITVSLQGVMVYNEDQLSPETGKPGVQLSQALTIGIKHTLKNTK